MSAFRRLALPSAALVALGLLSAVLPGSAQQAPSDRFAFADTTLLRDTLDLRFDRLFELADSLRLTPDTLRALSIRWGFAPGRLIELADSMRVPVDSVGVVLDRERFNPLAIRGERVTEFAYTTGYNSQRTRSAWENTLDTRLVRDALFFSQKTTIRLERFQSTRATTLQQRRQASNEFGYRLGENTSLGARAVLTSFNSDDPSTIRKINEATSQYQFSLRTKRDRPGLATELNAFSGVVDENLSQGTKRGVNGEVNGRLVLERGSWLQNDWSGRATGNFARTTPTRSQLTQNTRDIAQELRSTLTLWSSAPVSFNADLAYRDSRPQLPDENGLVTVRPSSNTDVNSSLRVRLDSDRSFNIQAGTTRSKSVLGTTSGGTEGRGANLQAEARARVLNASVEVRFRLGSSRSETPSLDTLGGYGEKSEDRGLEASLTRQFLGQRLSTTANGRVSLQRSRYYTIGSYASLPVPRDVAAQSYRLEGRYSMSREFSTSAALEVSRQEQVNLTSSSVASNTLTRTYRATWSWTYRMLQALTITQLNTLLANYAAYPFNAPADRLLLEYANTTTLNAVLTPRFSMDLNHVAQLQPSGGYTIEQSDGFYYFRPADETRTYSVGLRTSYNPGPVLTLTMEPRYRWSNRDATSKGVLVPQRGNANLSFSGAALLNYSVGRNGRVSGSVTRIYNGDRNVGYKSGVVETLIRSNTDTWTANLQFSWKLQ